MDQKLDRPGKPDKNVLVVDDEPGLREIMAIELEMNGYSVMTAPNGREAYEMIEKNAIDTVVSDVGMPDGDGLELLDKILERERKTGKKVQVILMTGFSGISRDEAKNRGAWEMLMKPFLIEDLLSALSQGAAHA